MSGMCCALNSVDAMRNTTYGLLVEEMQNHLMKSEKNVAATVGRKEGLTLVLDLHSNHASFGTVTDNYNAFNLFIGGPTEFPVLRERSLQLEPGKEHSLEFSGQVKQSGLHSFDHSQVLSASGIQDLEPSHRGCFFPDEGNLQYYDDYTFTNCRCTLVCFNWKYALWRLRF